MTKITVILPCAGEGSRLGLKSPKELLEIIPGIRLIDFSLEHIRQAAAGTAIQTGIKKVNEGLKVQVAVVTRPWKKEVVEYVAGKLPGVAVHEVLFNDAYEEWPGSVYSAADSFSEYNLVLLPDSVLCLTGEPARFPGICIDPHGYNLAQRMAGALEKYAAVFGVVTCTDAAILGGLGAVKVEKNEITMFQDKPRGEFESYNGFWGCYGFRGDAGKTLYDFLVQSVRHEAVCLQAQPFYPVGAISLQSYMDLGTWERIATFRDLWGGNL